MADPIDDAPIASPMIISESTTHLVIALELPKAALARHRRFIEQLLAAAPAAAGDNGG
jgi:hypothetical protein